MKDWLSSSWNVAVLVALLVLAACTLTYRHLYRDADKALAALQAQVKRQNEEAGKKLAKLTAERDSKQAALEKSAAAQEKKDAEAEAEIARLGNELRNRPVRVRLVAAGGGGGGSAPSDGAAAAGAGTEDTGPAYGLLAPENSRRLAGAIVDIETLNAAYASCRARLIRE